jgi:hypothetical protein
MSYMNQPYAPMPPQGPPPRKMSTAKIVMLTVGGLFALIIVFSVIGAALSGGGSDDGKGTQEQPGAAQPKDADAEKAAGEEQKDRPKDDAKKEKTEPKPEPEAKSYGDGDYVVGEDIPPGTYESAGANSDIFDLCTITTEPKGDKFPQAKTGNKGERIIITLSEGDGTLTVQGCRPLKER